MTAFVAHGFGSGGWSRSMFAGSGGGRAVESYVPAPERGPVQPGVPSTLEPPLVSLLKRPLSDQLVALDAMLSLNRSLLARVLGISRPTLYAWLDGSGAPNPTKVARLHKIIVLLERAGVHERVRLDASYVRNAIAAGQPALIAMLEDEVLDEDRIVERVREVHALGEAEQRRLREREVRLRNLGFETPSHEQAREALADIVDHVDWPK